MSFDCWLEEIYTCEDRVLDPVMGLTESEPGHEVVVKETHASSRGFTYLVSTLFVVYVFSVHGFTPIRLNDENVVTYKPVGFVGKK